MGKGQRTTRYQIEFAPAALEDLAGYGASTRQRLAKRIEWLAKNAAQIQHQRLSHLPPHLHGLCKYRVGHDRVLYWIDHEQRKIAVFRIMPRKADYRLLRRS